MINFADFKKRKKRKKIYIYIDQYICIYVCICICKLKKCFSIVLYGKKKRH